jgi:hypothetical protein
VLGPGVVLEGRPVEPVELVVQDPGEGQRDRGRARLQRLRQAQGAALLLLVELHRGGDGGPALGDAGLVHLELDGVQHDHVGGLRHLHVDLHGAPEGGRPEVRLEEEVVAPGHHRARQPVRVGVGGGHAPQASGGRRRGR